MSLGALSREAHETLAIGVNRFGGKSNSGVFSPHQLAPISPASADRPPQTWGSIL